MSDLVKVFERFLGRDLIYIFAGTLVLTCIGRILWAEGCLREHASLGDLADLEKVSWVWKLLAGGFAWVVGLMLQELFCVIRISSTAIEGEPLCFVKCVFRWYQRKDWIERKFGPDGEVLSAIRLSSNKDLGPHLERSTYLMQAGTSLGPASLFAGAFLIAWWLGFGVFPNQGIHIFDKIAGVFLLLAGVFFLLFGPLKRAQLREYVFLASR